MSITGKAEAPAVGPKELAELGKGLDVGLIQGISRTARLWADFKQAGKNVVIATGSGPNLHEGATTMIAAMIRAGLVDGVLTSSAVAGHEMAGSLERVKRVEGAKLGFDPKMLPSDGRVEVSLISKERLEAISRDIEVDLDHYRRMLAAPGKEITKVAGNLAYPTGLWGEIMAERFLPHAQEAGEPFEALIGGICDPLTMLGAAARAGIPCLVTVPQLVGGGAVGMTIGDSIPISRRSGLIADTLAGADLLMESGLALAQEIHDGPFELYTGHGIWARHTGRSTFSLKDKQVVRIDLDPHIERIWSMQREAESVSQAIHGGKPKAAGFNMPLRMELSGFARLPHSSPLTGDLGVVWPLLASELCSLLDVKLEFMCYKQGTVLGEALRQYIVDEISPMDTSLSCKKDQNRHG
jgi:hypothetical protein